MSSFFGFDTDPIWDVLIRFVVTLLVLFIIIRLIYYRYTNRNRRRNVFSFFQMGIMIFLVCILLKTVEVQLGIALGLFAIFAIMRFRSENLSLREMTYFFTVIGISVINAMATFYNPVRGTILINIIVILSVFLLETLLKKRNDKKKKKPLSRTILLYNRLELLDPMSANELLGDVSSRTHLDVVKIEIRKIDLIKGIAELDIFFKDKASGEN